jgi:hypothetical protein
VLISGVGFSRSRAITRDCGDCADFQTARQDAPIAFSQASQRIGDASHILNHCFSLKVKKVLNVIRFPPDSGQGKS